MRACFQVTALFLVVALSACSAERVSAAKPAPTAQIATPPAGIDPSIPTVTITARRMSPAEKQAYDASLDVKLAASAASR